MPPSIWPRRTCALKAALQLIIEIDRDGHKRADDYGRAYRIAKRVLENLT